MLIKYETSLLAEKKGYPQRNTYDFWLPDGETMTDKHYCEWLDEEDYEGVIAAPRQSLLQKWLRDEHKMSITVHPLNTGKWEFVIFFLDQPLEGTDGFKNKMSLHVEPYYWDSYEETLEAALVTGLNLIK